MRVQKSSRWEGGVLLIWQGRSLTGHTFDDYLPALFKCRIQVPWRWTTTLTNAPPPLLDITTWTSRTVVAVAFLCLIRRDTHQPSAPRVMGWSWGKVWGKETCMMFERKLSVYVIQVFQSGWWKAEQMFIDLAFPIYLLTPSPFFSPCLLFVLLSFFAAYSISFPHARPFFVLHSTMTFGRTVGDPSLNNTIRKDVTTLPAVYI